MVGRMARRTAIVADRRPLERGLARFVLEERGLYVVGEAATMADVLLQVQQFKPDFLVLHEKLALDHDPTVVAQIHLHPKSRAATVARSASPRLVGDVRWAMAGSGSSWKLSAASHDCSPPAKRSK